MSATHSLIYFPKQSKRTPRKKQNPGKPKPKATVLEWIRNGYQFPTAKPSEGGAR